MWEVYFCIQYCIFRLLIFQFFYEKKKVHLMEDGFRREKAFGFLMCFINKKNTVITSVYMYVYVHRYLCLYIYICSGVFFTFLIS